MIINSCANDATRATNKVYALQKSCDCPITILTLLTILTFLTILPKKITGGPVLIALQQKQKPVAVE